MRTLQPCGVDTSLLFLKNWFLYGDYRKNTISNGTMAQELPPRARRCSSRRS
ncbi:hypothetical protein [Nonomuraea africana]|uniref:hypothetical protein n=1 Tax=Nonomuraea africana TaxID=46171 RepID=UPI00340F9F62